MNSRPAQLGRELWPFSRWSRARRNRLLCKHDVSNLSTLAMLPFQRRGARDWLVSLGGQSYPARIFFACFTFVNYDSTYGK